MVTRVFRAAIFAGVMLALWTLSRPAHASGLAPFCDDRGATLLAAPPALEATDEAVRRAAAPPCETDTPMSGVVLGHAHPGVRAVPADAAPATATTPSPQVPPALDGPLAFVPRDLPPQAGVRYRVERPPRG
jgi:hypothetical protein